MNNNPLVTIMIPTYNQEEYIVETVNSALSQTYKNIEVIVSDDSTNDKTKDVLKVFDAESRFTYSKNKKNLGRVANYNHLLYNLSNGEYVLNLDGDDYLSYNNFIEEAVELFLENRQLVLVGGKYQKLNSETNTLIPNPSKFDGLSEKTFILDGFKSAVVDLDSTGMGHLTELYNAALAKKIGFYNQDYITSDSESILRLIMHGEIGFINKYVGVWRYHTLNASQFSDNKEFYASLEAFDSVYNYALKLEKPKDLADEYRLKSHELIYMRIYRKIYQTKDYKSLKFFFKQVHESKVVSIFSLFLDRGMLRKTASIMLNYPKVIFYLFKAK